MKTMMGYIILISLLLPFSVVAKKGDRNKGAKVWSDNCGRCHNIRDARELRDDQWVTTVFHMRIRAGLTGQEARDVLSFLTDSNNPQRNNIFTNRVSTSSEREKVSGKIIYDQTCVACHGANGKGTLEGAPDFTSSKGPLSKKDNVLIKNITEGFQSPGSPIAMPAKGGKTDLTAENIRAVLTYIRMKFGN